VDLSKKIEILFERYLQNNCTEDEIKFLSEYFEADENETTIKHLILAEIESSATFNSDSVNPQAKRKVKKIFKKIIKEIRKIK
jgi:hypothetical protein